MTRKGKITAVRVEIGENDKVIIRIPYNQELINKIKMISGRRRNSVRSLRHSFVTHLFEA